MRKWLILAGLALVAVSLVAIAVANLDSYLNENKAWLEEQAAAAVGRPVGFDRVAVSVWPGLAVDVMGLHIADHPSYSSGNLVEIAEVRVRVGLLSALFGDLDVSGIAISQPVLTLIQTSDGLNLETLGGEGESAAEESSESAAEESPLALAAVIAFLDISAGEIRYIDRRSDPSAELRVERIEFEAEDVGLVEPIRFELAASLLGSDGEQNVRLAGTVGPISAAAPLQTPVDVQLKATFAMSERLAAIADLAALGATVDGEVALAVSARGAPGAPASQAGSERPQALAVEAVIDAGSAAVRYGDSFDKPAGVPLELTLLAHVAGETIDIEKGGLSVADATVRYRGRVRLDPLRYELRGYDIELDSEPISLGGREMLLPPLSGLGLGGNVALDVGAAGAASSSGLPRLSGAISLSDVQVRLPDQPQLSGFSGSLQLRDGGAFLAPSSFAIDGTAGSISLAIADLDEPVLKLNLTSASGRLYEVDYDKLDVAASYLVASSLATLDRSVLALYGGEVVATGRHDSSDPDSPAVALDCRVAALRLEEMLAAWFDPAGGFLEGKLGGELQLAGRGTEWDSLKTSLTGAGALSLDDAVLHNVDLGEELLGQLTAVPGLQLEISESLASRYPVIFGGAPTRFQDVRGQLEVRDGRVLVDNLRLVAGDYTVRASGSVSLGADVDLQASFIASQALTQSLIDEASVLRYLRDSNGRIEIPFALKGALDGAMYAAVDLKHLGERVAPALIGNLLGKLAGPKRQPEGADGAGPASGEPSAEASEDEAKDPVQGLLRDLLRGR